MDTATTTNAGQFKPSKLTEMEKETLLMALDKVTESIDSKIGNLQYLINKTTTHPNQMADVDFAAVNTAQEMVHFLNVCKTVRK
jgi:hypothetical protein